MQYSNDLLVPKQSSYKFVTSKPTELKVVGSKYHIDVSLISVYCG